jgi:hypothetical protein
LFTLRFDGGTGPGRILQAAQTDKKVEVCPCTAAKRLIEELLRSILSLNASERGIKMSKFASVAR